jgi:hypothetical protein
MLECFIYFTFIWKGSLNSDGQQHEQIPLILTQWKKKNTRCDLEIRLEYTLTYVQMYKVKRKGFVSFFSREHTNFY